MNSRFAQHAFVLHQVCARLRQRKLSTLLIMLVIAIALCLPAALYSVIQQVQSAVGGTAHKPEISLYLKLDIDEASKQAIEQQLKQHPHIAEFRFVSKATAWQNLQQDSVQKQALDALAQNPLPDAYFIVPKQLDSALVQAMQKEMQSWHGVDIAQLDAKWLQRLNTLLQLANKLSYLLMILLGIATLAIVGNTIRLQFLTQRDEIEVSQLIGATRAFIRRPFLYTGTLYGIGGALLAYGLWISALSIFNLSIMDIADLYASQFRLQWPGPCALLVLIMTGAILGCLGAYASVSRALANLESS